MVIEIDDRRYRKVVRSSHALELLHRNLLQNVVDLLLPDVIVKRYRDYIRRLDCKQSSAVNKGLLGQVLYNRIVQSDLTLLVDEKSHDLLRLRTGFVVLYCQSTK